MAFRIMLRTGLRVSESLSMCRSTLRLDQGPPVFSVRPEALGNKGLEVPITADRAGEPGRSGVVSLQGPQPAHAVHLPPVGWGEHEARRCGRRHRSHPGPPPRPPPHLRPQLRPPASQSQSCSSGWGISPWPTPSATWSWLAPTTSGWPGFDHRCAYSLRAGTKLRVCRTRRRAKKGHLLSSVSLRLLQAARYTTSPQYDLCRI